MVKKGQTILTFSPVLKQGGTQEDAVSKLSSKPGYNPSTNEL